MDSGEHYAYDCAVMGDHQLDMEVNRFLEADFALLHQFDSDTTAADPLTNEMHFMDISNSIDIPDLDFGDKRQVTDNAPHARRSTEAAATTSVSQPSLRVVIPASALFPQSPSDSRLKRKASKPKLTWSQIWSKRQKAVKNELLSLHQQVNMLESKLERLRQNAGAPTNFKQILKREIDEKKKSDAENAKLKRMLETELDTACRVAKVLRKCEGQEIE
ncbi:hypothetical protein Gpo141_00013668 [Globisporangium polare]